MKFDARSIGTAGMFLCILAVFVFSAASCGGETEQAKNQVPPPTPVPTPVPEATPTPTPEQPDLQSALMDNRFRETASPLKNFDFKNHNYPLPRGWQDPDGSDIQLENGERKMTGEKIGIDHVTTKYFDVTGDGQDEAFVILKIVTAGSAIPQIAYIFSWKDDKPELIWYFRTGDRADGGLKDLRPEEGMLVIELYGQDRFILGEVETGKITGDEEQICCPTNFSRNRYKWNGRNFLMQGKRLTYLVANPDAPPIENLGDKMNDPNYKPDVKR